MPEIWKACSCGCGNHSIATLRSDRVNLYPVRHHDGATWAYQDRESEAFNGGYPPQV